MREGDEGQRNVVNIRGENRFFSHKEGESLAEYKRRVTHYIRVMERRVGGLQKNVEDWTTEYTNWSSEAQRLEGLRGELTPNWPLPQRESALWHARERAVAAQERRDWYEGDLKKAEVDLERYRQFRISLDLQTKYSKRDK